MDYSRRSKWENQAIHTRFKNRRHTKSNIKKRSSNSLKQDVKNGKFNLQLFNRLYSYKVNHQYSLSKYLKLVSVYNDYDMILYDNCNDCNYCEYDGYPINIKQWKANYNKKINNIKKKKSQKHIRKITHKTTNITINKPIKSIPTKTSNKSNSNEIKAKQLYNMYNKIYFAKNKSKDIIIPIINNMMNFISKKDLIPKTEEKYSENNNTQCKVCYCDTKDDDTLELVSMIKYCSHCMICSYCFIQHVTITIVDDENILPWLLCPAQNCKAAIDKDLLLKYININDLYTFAYSFIYKHLQRNKYWINCNNCRFGWIVINKNKCNSILKCKGCENNHKIKNEIDNGFKELILNGIMKECPQCNYPTMKDYGMCNVMHCGKCNVYWNWRTKDIGSSSNEVKQKARNNGTLWEAGELSYQQNLERNNLKEFIALLGRNGIKYDPNYRRGS
eukprot:454493_1